MAAEATTMPAAAPVSAQVANAFVQQYYQILHQSPQLVYRFYQDISKLGRPETDGSLSITTTMQAINEKIVSLNYENLRAEIKSVDAQESYNGGFQVLVTGYLTGKDHSVRNFAQSFFLAPQDVGYFVLNDMFRYVSDVPATTVVNDVVRLMPIVPDPMSAPVLENHVSEQCGSPVEEIISGEVHNPTENGHVEIVEKEVPVAEVVDEVPDDSQVVVESSAKAEEAPKKSYASIVMHLKKSAASFSPPQAASKAPPKNVDQLKPSSTIATDGSVSSSEAVDNGTNPEGEADGYSIYVKGLPMSATVGMLEEVFKKFGTIKSDGIQVRSLRQQGFCFGFVEFDEASAAQKALETSPVLIGGRQAFVEEKRSTTNSRGNNSGRFQSGRGSGFRNEGGRGRGNYGGGRGYSRVEFNGRNEFVNRGNYRGGSSNRDGYQRPENMNSNGGRMNRAVGMTNGSAKHMVRPVSATA
ncbi:nuclear transport factor 2-like isoform X2 [Henckelia pumila]|uniref:nuclear transport factor 2-like isoform X2 n=1 Tax=Henckelia pumila TaxID=405737 RepID=UPI003C6DF786